MSKKIRVWNLADLDYKITPSQEMVEKFSALLEQANKGEITDIVWSGPLSVMEVDLSEGEDQINNASQQTT